MAYNSIFAALDADGSGGLTKDEVAKRTSMSAEQIDQLYTLADVRHCLSVVLPLPFHCFSLAFHCLFTAFP